MRRSLLGLIVAAAVLSASPVAARCPATDPGEYAQTIANGHAFDKHGGEFVQGRRIAGLAFPDATILDVQGFAAFLTHILASPDTDRPLRRGRHAYWDARTGTVIITNRAADDCGTAFRPNAGVAYYDRLN